MRTTLNLDEDAALAARKSDLAAVMRALPDVNVWVALFDDAHPTSDRVNAYIEARGRRIATCALLENGVGRVLSLPGYGQRGGLSIPVVRERLRLACSSLDHEFWPDDISLRDDARVDCNRVQGHNQITDLDLLALAVHHGGCLATFDQAIALSSVRGATARHLLLL